MKTNEHSDHGDMRVNHEKSAEVIVVTPLPGTKDCTIRIVNNLGGVRRFDDLRKQENFAIIKELVWNT